MSLNPVSVYNPGADQDRGEYARMVSFKHNYKLKYAFIVSKMIMYLVVIYKVAKSTMTKLLSLHQITKIY